jgi:hypothetical protein
MSTQFIDSQNIVNSADSAPDRLRAELGDYYDISSSANNYPSGKIKSFEISPEEINNNQLIPTKKQKITIEGDETMFRDHIQWNSFVNSLISTGEDFLDHTFSYQVQGVQNKIVKNYHHPSYEDATKVFPSNQLLNFNLLSYPYESDVVKRIGHLKTTFESNNDLSSLTIENLMDQYNNRVDNYSGSAEELYTKQSFIFDMTPMTGSGRTKSDFPYYYEKHIDSFGYVTLPGINLYGKLKQYGKTKNIFKLMKENLFFERRAFTSSGQEQLVNMHDLISLLTSDGLVSINESSNEIYLVPEGEINFNNRADRFVNQIHAAKLLSDVRSTISARTRNLNRIFELQECGKSILGYKIEKYLNNDATGPIQTYYVSDSSSNYFIDTQLKHGSRYIYKTKVLIAVFGSSYNYSNLSVAQSDFDGGPSKYWAEVDVEILPSFKVLEYEIDNDATAFIDTPSLKPHTTIYGRKDKPIVNFLFQPRFFTLTDDEGNDMNPPIGNLTESDRQIKDLYDLAPDRTMSAKYFTGIYEIYRMNRPPEHEQDFADFFLSRVDESVDSGNLDRSGLPIKNIDVNYARFTDRIVPNQKYYYAFRSLTYHGTPSQLSEPIEVELQKDSDEYKISVKQHHYTHEKDYELSKPKKRLMRIVPNISRLLFSENTNDPTSYTIDDGSLVSKAGTKTFKIRVTSRHTGKKMDINITFKLNEDDTFSGT